MAWMFRSSEPVLVFDYLRVPYAVTPDAGCDVPDGLAVLAPDHAPERRLLWPSSTGTLLGDEAPVEARYRDAPIFVQVAADSIMASALGPGWSPAEPIEDRDGDRIASIWHGPEGSMCLPFNPADAIAAFWSEEYLRVLHPGRPPGPSAAVRAYYRVRPLIPRRLQIAARRAYARRAGRPAFPRWPLEPALHDLVRSIYLLVADLAGHAPPWIAPWPSPYAWALVLTHDVETSRGYEQLEEILEIERTTDSRSAWNLVPHRYPVGDGMVSRISEFGGEVGVHGLHHDGRDLASLEFLEARLPAMHTHAAAWGAVGFRSPATQRRWDLMPTLNFDYDSSYPHSDPYEPQPGGSCSWLPYMIGDMVELPITLPQDHTLFVILQEPDAHTWLEATARLRARGGMALLLTHPDYLGDPVARRAYRALLEAYAGDATAWRPLPREVSAWWRRRSASTIVRDRDGWRIDGPATDEATITCLPPG